MAEFKENLREGINKAIDDMKRGKEAPKYPDVGRQTQFDQIYVEQIINGGEPVQTANLPRKHMETTQEILLHSFEKDLKAIEEASKPKEVVTLEQRAKSMVETLKAKGHLPHKAHAKLAPKVSPSSHTENVKSTREKGRSGGMGGPTP